MFRIEGFTAPTVPIFSEYAIVQVLGKKWICPSGTGEKLDIFKNPPTLQEFSKLAGEGNIIGFVKKYGFLFDENNREKKIALSDIRSEIRIANAALYLWKYIQIHDIPKIKKILSVDRCMKASKISNSLEDFTAEFIGAGGELTEEVRPILEEKLNIKIGGRNYLPSPELTGYLLNIYNDYDAAYFPDLSTAGILKIAEYILWDIVQTRTGKPRISFDMKKGSPLSLIPVVNVEGLLSYMYLEFSQVFISNSQFKPCKFPGCTNFARSEHGNNGYCKDHDGIKWRVKKSRILKKQAKGGSNQ